MKPKYRAFNRTDQVIEGWYWVLRSRDLKPGKVKAVNILGRELAVYRTKKGRPVIVDAYCPHMGAHLATGRVEQEGIRCFFHFWKYDTEGNCVEIPSLRGGALSTVKLKTWPAEEKYGLVWVWTGERPWFEIPSVPELEGAEICSTLGNRFQKKCHPHTVLMNAIDEHHFNSVHRLPAIFRMEARSIHSNLIEFVNTSRAKDSRYLRKIFQWLYRDVITYRLSYYSGSTGIVTMGPDFLHFYLMFTMRQGADGGTEGQTVVITKKRKGICGFIVNRLLLFLSRIAGHYFAIGDTLIFDHIRFDFKTPVSGDHAVIEFIRHIEHQTLAGWREETLSTEVLSPCVQENCL